MFDNGFDPGFVVRHPVFLVTYIIAIPAWLIAFAAQCAAEARYSVDGAETGRAPVCGVLWFSIWIQLAVLVHLFLACATDGLAIHRFQLSIVLAIVVVFAVFGTEFIFESQGSLIAVGVGWLLTCMVDLVWLLYLTSEEETLFYSLFTAGGTGGLSGFSSGGGGRRRQNISHAEANYGVSSAPMRSGSTGGGMGGMPRGISSNDVGGVGGGGGGYPMGGYSAAPIDTTPQKSVAAYGSANGHGAGTPSDEAGGRVQRAKANFAYAASPDDPNEVSFGKNDILEVVDASGKWWQVRTPSGQVGIAPSNYLALI